MWTGDTIVAVSSAPPPARRVVVRLSGPQALLAASRVVRDLPAGRGVARTHVRLVCRTADPAAHELHMPAIVAVFRSPSSYTGEDVVELGVPGSSWVVQTLLTRLLACEGVRSAEPGEFTARAFLNGRLDLTAAEGVAATIAAADARQLAAAGQLRSGVLLRTLEPVTDKLAEWLARVEAGIDFSDEDVRFITPAELAAGIDDLLVQLREVVARGRRFGVLAAVPRIVLAGPPNAGKSTLLNALAGRPRAVASPVAGTTRDRLEARIRLPRGEAVLTDTAGLPDASAPPSTPGSSIAEDPLTPAMLAAARQAITAADVLAWVVPADGSVPDVPPPRPPDLLIRTMADRLPDATAARPFAPLTGAPAEAPSFLVSALTGEGLDRLREALDEMCFGRPGGDGLALTARHLQHLHAALDELSATRQSIASGQPVDELTALSLRAALDSLGHISGAVSPDDVLGRVFATFCIGK
ncbi:MAG: tRNA modification GTPase [Tepidisphaerales bacterium]